MTVEPAEIKIERLAAGGSGMGKLPDGRVCFIPYTAPGDTARAAIRAVKSGHAEANLLSLLASGPGRVEPRCPLHFRPGGPRDFCGGCDWQHLSPDAQAEAKREIVRDSLFRIARLREPRVEETLRSPEAWRYRNKVQVPFARGPKGPVAGFFAPWSHRVIDFADCPVQPEITVRVTLKVKELARRFRWTPYDEDAGRGWLRHLYLRSNREGKVLAAFVTKTPAFPALEEALSELRRSFPELIGIFQNVQPAKTSVVLGPRWKKLWGSDRIEERVGKVRLLVSPQAFLQVNTPSCEVLYGVVSEFLSQGGFRPEVALDLYSGVGSIALWIAPLARKVIGVEQNREAVGDAWTNAKLNGIRNARFIAGGVEVLSRRLIKDLSGLAPGSAAAVLDPPRSGCERPALKLLKERAFGRVVYVSCNPATFARDIDRLARWGWRLTRVQPVDMFPQTSHIETVGLLIR